MHYECPICSSMKKPKIKSYFPPITVNCMDCGHVDKEEKFIHSKKPNHVVIQ